MIWKIENIEDSDQPVAWEIFENLRGMLQSLGPDKRISLRKLSKITSLVNRAEKNKRTGQNRSSRDKLREAYALLDKMNCERSSELNGFQLFLENKKSWSKNYLDKSLIKILRQHPNT